MTIAVTPHLNFRGDARAALERYRSVFGGELTIISYADMGNDDPAIADGWEVRFSEILVTVDHVTLSDGPDNAPTDPSQTGAVVAALDGPWAADLQKGGPIEGKGGGGERAVLLGSITSQNKKGGEALEDGLSRAAGFLENVARKAPGTTLVVVTHGEIAAALLSKAAGISPLAGYQAHFVDEGTISDVGVSVGEWHLYAKGVRP